MTFQIRMSASNNAAAIATANNPKRNLRSGDSTAIRSLSASLKFPYKRTISAPAGSYIVLSESKFRKLCHQFHG